MEPIGSELKAIYTQPSLQIRQKPQRGFFGALADLNARYQLGFSIQSDNRPLIAEFHRIVLADASCFLSDEAPNLVALQVVRTQVANAIHGMRGVRRCRLHQRKNRVLVQSRDTRDGANAHSLKHQGQRLCCGLRVGVVSSQLGNRFAERGLAGCAAPSLNTALPEKSEPLAGLVLASTAGHVISPLAFCGETSQNVLWSEAWVTPRFGLAPTTVDAAAGALSYRLLNGVGRIAKRGLLSVRPLRVPALSGSYLAPKSIFFANGPTTPTPFLFLRPRGIGIAELYTQANSFF